MLYTYQCQALLPPPGQRWGFANSVAKKTHPRGKIFVQFPFLGAPKIVGIMCGSASSYTLCKLNSYFLFGSAICKHNFSHENIFKFSLIFAITRSLLVGHILLAKDTQIPTYAQEGGVGLQLYRCSYVSIIYI